MNLAPLDKKWDSFLRMEWKEVDGHDFDDLRNVFITLKNSEKPKVIIAHTLKGKGISLMEDDNTLALQDT